MYTHSYFFSFVNLEMFLGASKTADILHMKQFWCKRSSRRGHRFLSQTGRKNLYNIYSTHKTQLKGFLLWLCCCSLYSIAGMWKGRPAGSDEMSSSESSPERVQAAGALLSLCVGLLFVTGKRLLFSGSNQTALGHCKDPVLFSSQLLHTPR